MNKTEGLEQIERLVKKYERLTPAERRQYNESMTSKDLILPLFQALGWDVYNKVSDYEVTSETKVSNGRVDYAFHLNNVTKFFVEAKKVSVDLREEKWAEQTVMYAWHKSVPWAILTDFESLKVFNAEWDEPDTERSLIFEISYKDYLSDERLWFLSKQSMEEGVLDKYAEEHFKKPKRESVDKKLVADLLRWRDKLFDDFAGYNPPVSKEKIAENVQKVLNRLIFIRTCEDRNFEDRVLQELVRRWREDGKNSIVDGLRKLFVEFDKNYDSKLFEDRILFESDKFLVVDDTLAKVIEETYKSSKGIRWNFNDISADVLGSIYEQYLGKIQGDGAEKKSSKRKSQGIYYTPRYIVDYIVQNTLGEVLKTKKTFHETVKIKVLDPACGSGSFLIKAFEILDRHLRKTSGKFPDFARKHTVLTSSIYGVDLDPQAVEIAQLNLSLKALEKRERLPNLADNIECGNSLISGTEQELRKYFGANWKDKKPFNWEERFSDVFEKGGFDVVIGNPPYLSIERGLLEDTDYFKNHYKTIEKIYDIFGLFIEKGLDLLKEGGYLGFIVPNIVLQNDSFRSLRKFILDNADILSIDNYKDGVFEDAVVPTAVLLLRKNHKGYEQSVKVNLYENKKLTKTAQTKQSNFLNSPLYRFNISLDEKFNDIKTKTFKKSISLKHILKVQEAIKTGDDKTFISNKPINSVNQKILLKGSDIDRYVVTNERFINYDTKSLKRPGKKEVFEMPKKLYIRRIADRIIAILDDKKRFAVHTLYTGVLINKDYSYEYILALLNSNLFTYLYRNLHPFKGSVFPEIRIGNLGTLPVREINGGEQKDIINLVNILIDLNKELQKLDPDLEKEEYDELKKKINETDNEIDKKVYKLYGLTPEEIKMVEESAN